MTMARIYSTLPPLPQAGPLDDWSVGLIVPQARMNLIVNPSFETNTTSWAAVSGSIARTTNQQYHGAYSLEVTPTAASDTGAAYTGALSLTAGTTYAVSLKILGIAGVTYSLSVRTTGATTLTETQFTATGRWQWIWLFHTETSSATRRIYSTKIGTNTGLFYIDGVQVEACGSEGVFVTTYIDGDQLGLVPNQFPPPYLWMGTPHASTSQRSGQTRAGGRVLDLKMYGLLISTILGLGLAQIEHEVTNFAQLDGAQYLNTRKTGRLLTLQGRWNGATSREKDSLRSLVAASVDRDLIGTRQPLVLRVQHVDPDTLIPDGNAVQIAALYQGGLEGNQQFLPTADATITFTQFLPYIVGGDGGGDLNENQTITSNYIANYNLGTGVWSGVGGGLTAGGVSLPRVNAFARAPNGLIYVGGEYRDAGSSGADMIATWDPVTSTWAVVGSATALNDTVFALAAEASGSIIAGGQFTNASGIAAADAIARWNGSTWSALGTGINGPVFALAIQPTTGDIYAGGLYTDAGGSGADNIARWNGSTWNVLGSATALNGQVNALVFDPSGRYLYVGGSFTNAGGNANADYIAVWDTQASTWGALGTGMSGGTTTVQALTIGPDKALYAGGEFTAAGGVSANRVARWNGNTWEPLGSGMNDDVVSLAFDARGFLHTGGVFTTAGGLAITGYAVWNGATWIYPDISLPGTPLTVAAILPTATEVFLGTYQAGSATTGNVATITNSGTAFTYPVLTIRGPSSGTARIYQITNVTTGKSVFLNYTINAGETATFRFAPDNISFTSDFQGNLAFTILAGSQEAEMYLQPGVNIVSFFGAGTTAATLSWSIRYASLEDTIR